MSYFAEPLGVAYSEGISGIPIPEEHIHQSFYAPEPVQINSPTWAASTTDSPGYVVCGDHCILKGSVSSSVVPGIPASTLVIATILESDHFPPVQYFDSVAGIDTVNAPTLSTISVSTTGIIKLEGGTTLNPFLRLVLHGFQWRLT